MSPTLSLGVSRTAMPFSGREGYGIQTETRIWWEAGERDGKKGEMFNNR